MAFGVLGNRRTEGEKVGRVEVEGEKLRRWEKADDEEDLGICDFDIQTLAGGPALARRL